MRLHFSKILRCFSLFFLLAFVLVSCNTSKFLADDELMLSSVKMTSSDKKVNASDYRVYVRQEPNAKWFNLIKVPLGIYSLSPADTTKRKGRFFRRIGEAPVVYDSLLTEYSRMNIENALKGNGFLHANVSVAQTTARRKSNLTYSLQPGTRYYVSARSSDIEDSDVERIYNDAAQQSLIKVGLPYTVTLLDEERSRVVRLLQDQGYFYINKDFITFLVDTIKGEQGAEICTRIYRPSTEDYALVYKPYRLRNVTLSEGSGFFDATTDTARSHNGRLIFATQKRRKHVHAIASGDSYTRRRIYQNRVSLLPDSLFSERNVSNTYSRLNALPTINSTAIRFNRVASPDSALLDAEIALNQQKPKSIGIDLEGTNTNGDLGAALVLSYTNRNFARGQEQFSIKLRGAYEAIKGLEGYNAQNFFEYRIETGLRFPTVRPPLVFRRSYMDYSSFGDINFVFDSEDRPEFHRRVLTANLSYRWTQNRHPEWQHRLDLLSLNYVFMPWISETFRETYLNNNESRNAILRASYENLLIMRWAYMFTMSSKKRDSSQSLLYLNSHRQKEWTFRIGAETAGNLLHAVAQLTHAHKDAQGYNKIFGVTYSQYAKFDLDYSFSYRINENNSIASHVAFGVAIPYGNSFVIPYEKRYFAGGANGVRGWSVRSLGPGGYKGTDGKVDFINQTGNLKLDLSVEWRSHLFWKFDGAAFFDAGNIWNTRKYEGLEAGQFKFDRFYKQIAVAYGLGLRFNVNYFVLRFDLGMKAINPAYETKKQHYPIIHPRLSRDLTFHFAVGLPF